VTVYSDRSRLLTYQHCNRERYLEFHLLGTGVRRNRIAIPLLQGSCVHIGRAHMLNQIIDLGPECVRPDLKVDVDAAVKAALDEYKAELANRGLDVELGEDAQAVVDEQVALTEGLLRAYAKAGLPRLLEQYRVLEVEREDLWERFTSVPMHTSIAADGKSGSLYMTDYVDFQSRADALLQERQTGDLYIDSLKTAAQYDHRKDEENRHDVQGLPEAAVVERRLRQDYEHLVNGATDPQAGIALPSPSYCEWIRSLTASPRIMGIQMTFLVKGIRRQAYEGAPFQTYSPLLRGYYREGVTEREFAWKAETPCPGPGHVLKQSKKGPILCEGKKFHKLGVDWVPFDTYRGEGLDIVGGVKGWVEMLSSGTVQPDAGDPFEAIIQSPLPYFRQDRDMADWIEQAQAIEGDVAAKVTELERIRVEEPSRLRSALNVLMPQNRRSCDWPSKCQMQEICFGDPSSLTSPFSTGLYQIRLPHHEAELGAMKVGALK
jgi:hypothetical protein